MTNTTRFAAPATVRGVRKHVDTRVQTQVCLGRTNARAAKAFAPDRTRLIAGAAVCRISLKIHAAVVALTVPLRAETRAPDTTQPLSTSNTTRTAVVAIVDGIYAAGLTHDAVGRARARPAHARLTRVTRYAAFAAVARVVEYVHTAVATIQESWGAATNTLATTLRRSTDVAARTAVGRIVVQPRAIAAFAQNRSAPALGHTFVAVTHELATIVATRPAIVVIRAQVDTLVAT